MLLRCDLNIDYCGLHNEGTGGLSSQSVWQVTLYQET